MNQKSKFALGRVKNIVGKGENAGYQHFLLFPQCFQQPTYSGLLKLGLWGKEFANDKMLDQSNVKDFANVKIYLT